METKPLFQASLDVPDGYVEVKRTVRVGRETAARWLKGARQRKYDRAARDGDCIALTRELIRCPHCGFEWRRDSLRYTPKRLPDSAIDAWLAQEDGARPLELPACQLSRYGRVCPRCHRFSDPCKGTTHVHIAADADGVLFAYQSADIHVLLKLMDQLSAPSLEVSLPFTEAVRFDLASGRAVLRIVDAEGSEVLSTDVTAERQTWEQYQSHALLTDNWLVRRRLAQAFTAAWGQALPFAQRKLLPEHFLLMTQFQRYPREFYAVVPYDLSTGNLDEGFRTVVEKLRDARDLPALYNASGLPRIKTVRRLFFQHPGFFFYLDEAAALWGALRDPNHFTRLMTHPLAFGLLTFFHQYPRAVEFIRDWAQCKDVSDLVKHIEERWEQLSVYMLYYAAMSLHARDVERRQWKKAWACEIPVVSFSTVLAIRNALGDCEIDGYSFVRLCSTRDCRAVGRAMENCLVNWRIGMNPVFAVMRDGEYAAAIELDGDEVVTALAPHNREINRETPLWRAIEKWMRAHRLRLGDNVWTDGDLEDIEDLLDMLQMNEEDEEDEEDEDFF